MKERLFMPLVARAFTPGTARETVEAIEDAQERELARAELLQFTGRAEEALALAMPYLAHEDPLLRITAHNVRFISGLAAGDAEGARQSLSALEAMGEEAGAPVSGAYCANALKIMLFLQEHEHAHKGDIPETLPEGVRFFASYFVALREYLRDEYSAAVGMARAALALGGERHPIAAIYLHILCAASLVRVRRMEEAERHFHLAWALARPDGFIAPFAQQYVMLAGLNKKCIKTGSPALYQEISRYADSFIPAWVEAHRGLVAWHADHGLTKTEHIAAMLFRKGLTVKEIALCMSISVNTVKRHIAMAYQKSDAKKREQLPQNIIR